MKIWIDDKNWAPEGYLWRQSHWDAFELIRNAVGDELTIKAYGPLEVIDIGDSTCHSKDYYVKLLKRLATTKQCYPIHLHTTDPETTETMRELIRKNGWMEV